jgi:hypothetical protein
MVKLHSTVMTHDEVQKVLPWYANKRLDADTSRRVETHLAACALCRGVLEGLNVTLAAHDRALPDRPVSEARLDALFARIDRHEAQRREATRRNEGTGQDSNAIARLMQWLTLRPALAAGSLAAVLLAVFMAPVMFQAQDPVRQEFQVLSTKGAQAPFVVRVQFATATEQGEVERSVAASVASAAELPRYRIEQRSPTDYAVVFDSKPSVAVAGQMLTQLGATPNVASVSIDGAAGR